MMGLFNKKTDKKSAPAPDIKLPELPEVSSDDLPSISSLEDPPMQVEVKNIDLPTLPGAQNNDEMNQNEIKNIINKPTQMNNQIENKGIDTIEKNEHSKFQLMESPPQNNPRKLGYIKTGNSNDYSKVPDNSQSFHTNRRNVINTNPKKDAEPIYIRLDKFQSTINTFEEMKNKIIEIENILNKIKSVREKEDSELEEWENEIQMIKSRIASVDKNIFDKLN